MNHQTNFKHTRISFSGLAEGMRNTYRQHPGRLLVLGLAIFFTIATINAPLRALFWDDSAVDETLPRNLWDITHWLSTRYWVVANHALFRPVVSWTLEMNREVGIFLGELIPSFPPTMAHRIFSMILHAIACYVVYIFSNRFTKIGAVAIVATLLFAV